jgi:dihydrodiol dehydrogenase / D-xylose 1-dehydrogenase (NADP)
VAARNLESAKEFAAHHNIDKAYGSYEELAKDPEVEVVYIGAINTIHYNAGKMMLESGKPLLVEKPLTLNLKCTKELISIAKSKNLFIMEALWSRYLPSYEFVMESIRNGVIGDVRHVSAHFCIKIENVDRVAKKELGGGTIVDIGIYVVNLIEMVYNGEMPSKICSVGQLNENGVDENVSATMLFSDGKTATFAISNRVEFADCFIIGTKGLIKV